MLKKFQQAAAPAKGETTISISTDLYLFIM